jgi:hypothetical protein
MLISYYHTIPAYIKRIEDVFLKSGKEVKPAPSISMPPAPGEKARP